MQSLQLWPVVVGDDRDETLRSPAYEEDQTKDQDRAVWVEQERGGVACVCDGLGSSWESGQAARHAVWYIQKQQGLWPHPRNEGRHNVDAWFLHHVDLLVSNLEHMRASGLQKPIVLSANMSEGEREIHEENIRQKRRSGYQTTIVVARLDYLSRGDDLELRVRYFKVGDSELFVFARDGTLLETTADLVWDRSEQLMAPGATERTPRVQRLMRFPHKATTDHLPDSLRTRVPRWSTYYFRPDVFVLLTSDGMIGAFDGPADMSAWLMEHSSTIHSVASLSDLHARLRQRGGDDDISFVWVPPAETA